MNPMKDESMEYRPPFPVTQTKAEASFRSGDASEICETLISAALTIPEREWVEPYVIRFLRDDTVDVKRAAAVALGHLARLHGMVGAEAIALVRELLGDGDLSGTAEDALSDVAIFTGCSRLSVEASTASDSSGVSIVDE